MPAVPRLLPPAAWRRSWADVVDDVEVIAESEVPLDVTKGETKNKKGNNGKSLKKTTTALARRAPQLGGQRAPQVGGWKGFVALEADGMCSDAASDEEEIDAMHGLGNHGVNMRNPLQKVTLQNKSAEGDNEQEDEMRMEEKQSLVKGEWALSGGGGDAMAAAAATMARTPG